METKICRICGTEKPLLDFPKNSQYPDGYDSRCKVCANEYARSRRAKSKGGGNPQLAEFTPRELIEELKSRGYTGQLKITKTISL